MLMNIRRSMIACFAVVSGVLFSCRLRDIVGRRKEAERLLRFSIRKADTDPDAAHVDIEELKQGRKPLRRKSGWMLCCVRSVWSRMTLTEREKWLLLTRMIPLVENNFNLCELGSRDAPVSLICIRRYLRTVSWYPADRLRWPTCFITWDGRQSVWLDCGTVVAFDEVAGIHFKDKDGVQIMKDYMASGSFARGKEEKAASASMVFVGNINQSVDVLLKTSSLFDPIPAGDGNRYSLP